jgi:transposase
VGLPPRKPREQGNLLDRYLPYVVERWEQGCHNIAQIYQELLACGYKGSSASVSGNLVRHLRAGRKFSEGDAALQVAPVLSRQGAFLFVRQSEKLEAREQETLVLLRQFHPEVDLASGLVQQFAQILRERRGGRLGDWLEQVERSHIPELQSFADGIEKDKDAVRAGLTWWINNGMVEGHVTKLKLIKRQGYGRAGFPRFA